MNDFILENQADGKVILRLHDNIRQPRIILPFIAGVIAAAVAGIIAPVAIQNMLHSAGPLARIEALIQLIVCLCFVVVAVASFLQAAVAGFGTQAWVAASGRLEFYQEVFGWVLSKPVRGEVILLSPPSTANSTSWKLAVAPNAQVEHIWEQRSIHISSDDDELRTIGSLLAGTTGWQFVDQSAR